MSTARLALSGSIATWKRSESKRLQTDTGARSTRIIFEVRYPFRAIFDHSSTLISSRLFAGDRCPSSAVVGSIHLDPINIYQDRCSFVALAIYCHLLTVWLVIACHALASGVADLDRILTYVYFAVPVASRTNEIENKVSVRRGRVCGSSLLADIVRSEASEFIESLHNGFWMQEAMKRIDASLWRTDGVPICRFSRALARIRCSASLSNDQSGRKCPTICMTLDFGGSDELTALLDS